MNCQQMGHFKSRCPNPHTEDGAGGAYGGGDVADANTDAVATGDDSGGAAWDSGATKW